MKPFGFALNKHMGALSLAVEGCGLLHHSETMVEIKTLFGI